MRNIYSFLFVVLFLFSLQTEQSYAENFSSSYRAQIRIDSYRLFIGRNNHIQCRAYFKNLGKDDVKNVTVTCYFVGNGRKNLGEDSIEFKTIHKGSQVIGIFTSNLAINRKKYSAEFSADGKIAIVRRGIFRSSPALYKIECRFKFE